jgi:hypothetical protein
LKCEHNSILNVLHEVIYEAVHFKLTENEGCDHSNDECVEYAKQTVPDVRHGIEMLHAGQFLK